MKIEDIQEIKNFDVKDAYITSLDIITNLLLTEFPIKNKNIAIKNVLEFLNYLHERVESGKSTVVPVSRNTFIKYFSRDTYSTYVQLLRDLKVLTKVPYSDGGWYTIGKKTLQYRVHSDYLNSEQCIVMFDNGDKITVKSEVIVNSKFKKAISETTVDIKAALIEEIAHKHKKGLCTQSFRSRINKLFSIRTNRYIKKGETVDRIYHSFTNLSRESRKHQSVKGKKYNEIDIVNCQPMLLCYLMAKKGLDMDVNYIADCESGTFYEKFFGIEGDFRVEEWGYWRNISMSFDRTDEDDNNSDIRNSIKVMLYRSVFFGFDTRNPFNMKFAQLYPNTHKFISSVPKDVTLASMLQNMESEVMNDIVPKHSSHFYTLFDGIFYTSEQDTEQISKHIRSKFSSLGLNVTLKINNATS